MCQNLLKVWIFVRKKVNASLIPFTQPLGYDWDIHSCKLFAPVFLNMQQIVWGIFTEGNPRRGGQDTNWRDFYIALLQLWDPENPDISVPDHWLIVCCLPAAGCVGWLSWDTKLRRNVCFGWIECKGELEKLSISQQSACRGFPAPNHSKFPDWTNKHQQSSASLQFLSRLRPLPACPAQRGYFLGKKKRPVNYTIPPVLFRITLLRSRLAI